MVFDKVEEGVLRLLEAVIKTDSGWLVGKLQLYIWAFYLLQFWEGTACPRQI